MGTIYSHSRLSAFENCPRQFRYRYLDRIPVESESVEAFMGKLVHAVVERLNLVTATGRVPSLGAVLRRYEAMWDEGFDPARVRIVREGAAPGLYRAIGARCTENFYRGHYPFDAEETLGIEEKVQVELDADGRYRLRGVIDRLARARDGAVEIHDYKTGQRVPPQAALDRDRQLALYQLALAERFPGEPVRLVWHYLASGQARSSTRTTEQLEALRAETIVRIDTVEGEREFSPKVGPLCRWCEYNQRCDAGRAHLGIGTPPPAEAAPSAPDPAPGPVSAPELERAPARAPASGQLALFS